MAGTPASIAVVERSGLTRLENLPNRDKRLHIPAFEQIGRDARRHQYTDWRCGLDEGQALVGKILQPVLPRLQDDFSFAEARHDAPQWSNIRELRRAAEPPQH